MVIEEKRLTALQGAVDRAFQALLVSTGSTGEDFPLPGNL